MICQVCVSGVCLSTRCLPCMVIFLHVVLFFLRLCLINATLFCLILNGKTSSSLHSQSPPLFYSKPSIWRSNLEREILALHKRWEQKYERAQKRQAAPQLSRSSLRLRFLNNTLISPQADVTHIWTHIWTHSNTHKRIHEHAQTHKERFTPQHLHTHTQIDIQTHTNTHTQRHTHILVE